MNQKSNRAVACKAMAGQNGLEIEGLDRHRLGVLNAVADYLSTGKNRIRQGKRPYLPPDRRRRDSFMLSSYAYFHGWESIR